MEFLGIGPSELAFIVVIALIILGPKDMQKAGKTIGKWLRDVITSDSWKVFQQTSREVRDLPKRLIREANMEELMNNVGTISPASNPAGTNYNINGNNPASASVSIDAMTSQPPATPTETQKPDVSPEISGTSSNDQNA